MSRFSFNQGSHNGNDAFTKIMLHMDGANGGTVFADDNSGGSAKTWTARGTAVTNTGLQKFGTTSLNCGANTGNIDTPDSSDFTLGSGDWTVDHWFNTLTGGGGAARRAYGQSDAAFTSSLVSISGGINATDVMFMQAFVGGVAFTVVGTTTFTSPGWHHYAAVRTGNILKLFVDGVQEGGNLAITGSINDASSVFAVGGCGATVNFFNGSIDEFRLSVGIARWTANFTPPVSPYF